MQWNPASRPSPSGTSNAGKCSPSRYQLPAPPREQHGARRRQDPPHQHLAHRVRIGLPHDPRPVSIDRHEDPRLVAQVGERRQLLHRDARQANVLPASRHWG